MSYREQQYIVVLNDGTHVGKGTREVQHVDPADTANVRKFGGARARRWVQRHPGLGAQVVTLESAKTCLNEVM